ncbi:MAG: PspC domain-containing protein, partial [Planctomycetes bacterium]|nr:PspC domain-containing protein [Planctomycetota bacterium]
YISGHLPEGRFEDPALFLSDLKTTTCKKWNELILRLLERDPAKRYNDAQEVLLIIDAMSSTEPNEDSIVSPHHHGHNLYRDPDRAWGGSGLCAGLGKWTGISGDWFRALFFFLLYCANSTDSGWFMVIGGYILLSLIIPKCPDESYNPSGLNNSLPRRGHGHWLGVCEMLGRRQGNVELWRWIFILSCIFLGFTPIVIIYIIIGAICPPAVARRNQPKTADTSATAVPKSTIGENSENSEHIPVAHTHNSILFLIPAIVILGLCACAFYGHPQLIWLSYVSTGLALYLTAHIHRQRPVHANSFNDFACGLAAAGGGLWILSAFIHPTIHLSTQPMHSLNAIFSHSSTHELMFFGMNATLFAHSLLLSALSWSLLYGRYGSLSIIIGFVPVAGFLHSVDGGFAIIPQLHFFNDYQLFSFGTALVLWIIASHISRATISWLLTVNIEQRRQYSITGTLIAASMIACIIIYTVLVQHQPSLAQIISH